MLTRDEAFTVVALVLTTLGLVISISSAAFALSSYKQSSVNNEGINAQVRAQRKLLASSLAQPAALGVVGSGAVMGTAQTAVLEALRALQEYKLPEDEGA